MTGMVQRPLRIAHLADTHLGYTAYGKADPESGRNQRAVDIERSFEAVITDILAREVDLVLHAGDVFHHTRPSWSTLTHFVRQMRRLEQAELPTVVIGGNHDTPRLRSTGSVFGLLALALPRIRFIAGYDTEEAAFPQLDVLVHGVPHGALVNPDPPAVLPDAALRNIVVAHGTAPGYEVMGGREAGEAELRGNVLDVGLDYVALGHEHVRGQAGINAWYSGSTERMSWRDQQAQPGYALVTLGERESVPQVEFIDLPVRPMETLHPIDGGDRSARELADTILGRAGALGLVDAMVRVKLERTPRPVFREAESIVRREIGNNAWYIQLTATGDLGGDDGDRDQPPDFDVLKLFDLFVLERVDATVYDEQFATHFKARGRIALEAAIQKMQDVATSESGGT